MRPWLVAAAACSSLVSCSSDTGTATDAWCAGVADAYDAAVRHPDFGLRFDGTADALLAVPTGGVDPELVDDLRAATEAYRRDLDAIFGGTDRELTTEPITSFLGSRCGVDVEPVVMAYD